ncbi:MAG: PilZ domain-containing protein [Gemmataceae bacterium]|nr:PilZ domain-containing protein [Gemmataceae bacterium]
MTPPSVLARQTDTPITPLDRRASIRLVCDLEVLSRPLEPAGSICWGATVQDVSEGGLGLLVCYPFKAGTHLTVELRTRAGAPKTVQARVVHAQDLSDGTWRVGCELTSRLSPEELVELL